MRAALFAGIALVSAPMAHAQTAVNDQYQLRGSTAVTTVETSHARDVGATAVASGNVVAGTTEGGDASLSNTQHMDGDANATANATVWHSDGNVAVTSAAVANGATGTVVNGNVDVTSQQLAHGDANAATHFTGGDASNAGASASASGNVGALSVENGQARLIASQDSTGSIAATVEANHCCVAGQAVSGAIASANNLTVGGDTATILTDTTQTASGQNVNARVDLYAGYAVDASGNATANANALTIDNQWGYVNARVSQTSTANVIANSYVTLGGDFTGFGSAGAYGVGNQANVSNVGSDTVMDTAQTNSGDIEANAALTGQGAGPALASSAAYGNMTTGVLCASCDPNGEPPTLTASNSQVNSGAVYSSATVVAPRADTVAATSTAIGNAATYQVRPPGG